MRGGDSTDGKLSESGKQRFIWQESCRLKRWFTVCNFWFRRIYNGKTKKVCAIFLWHLERKIMYWHCWFIWDIWLMTKKRNYPAVIKDFGGEILLVGINYDKDAPVGERKHTCVIEKYQVWYNQNTNEIFDMKIPEVIDSYRDFCLFAIIKNRNNIWRASNRNRNSKKIFDERQINT